MRVFVTGGTGLLGSHLIEHLRDHGHGVVALHRSSAETRFLSARGATLVEGDVRDSVDSLAEAMLDCTHVVHSAALVYSGGGWPRIREVNVQGTRNVLQAAAQGAVAQAVHISSVAVYGTADGEVDEAVSLDSPLPVGDLYARSKREAERAARDVEEGSELRVTVIRPSAVYGERDRLMAPAIADILRLPLVPLFGPGGNTLPVVYAGNVAVAIRLALEAGRGGETFDVGLDHTLTQRDLFELQAAGMGRQPRFVRLPAGMVRTTARLLTRLGVSTPGAKHLPLDRVARLALDENPYPSRRIRRELGWDPPHRHEQALERTGSWIAEHG